MVEASQVLPKVIFILSIGVAFMFLVKMEAKNLDKRKDIRIPNESIFKVIGRTVRKLLFGHRKDLTDFSLSENTTSIHSTKILYDLAYNISDAVNRKGGHKEMHANAKRKKRSTDFKYAQSRNSEIKNTSFKISSNDDQISNAKFYVSVAIPNRTSDNYAEGQYPFVKPDISRNESLGEKYNTSECYNKLNVLLYLISFCIASIMLGFILGMCCQQTNVCRQSGKQFSPYKWWMSAVKDDDIGFKTLINNDQAESETTIG